MGVPVHVTMDKGHLMEHIGYQLPALERIHVIPRERLAVAHLEHVLHELHCQHTFARQRLDHAGHSHVAPRLQALCLCFCFFVFLADILESQRPSTFTTQRHSRACFSSSCALY